MDEQTQASCGPSSIAEMLKLLPPYSLFPWKCHEEELGLGSHWQGWQMAQLSLWTVPVSPGVAPTQPSLLAPGRAAQDVPGAEHSRGGSATCVQPCQLLTIPICSPAR